MEENASLRVTKISGGRIFSATHLPPFDIIFPTRKGGKKSNQRGKSWHPGRQDGQLSSWGTRPAFFTGILKFRKAACRGITPGGAEQRKGRRRGSPRGGILREGSSCYRTVTRRSDQTGGGRAPQGKAVVADNSGSTALYKECQRVIWKKKQTGPSAARRKTQSRRKGQENGGRSRFTREKRSVGNIEMRRYCDKSTSTAWGTLFLSSQNCRALQRQERAKKETK